MDKFKYIVVIVLFITSCTQKDKYEDYQLSIQNNTNQEINIITYKESVEINNIIISSSTKGLECSYNSDVFSGYSGCNVDSIKIIFPNGKGYFCTSNLNDETFCFGNQITPLTLGEKFENSNNNVYKFIITEEDYNNALDIPE